MNLLDLLCLPVTAMIQGPLWICEQIREKAWSEMYDPDTLRSELIQLRVSFERGIVSKQEYQENAAILWERLNTPAGDTQEGDI